jgi:hypothetical protein
VENASLRAEQGVMSLLMANNESEEESQGNS